MARVQKGKQTPKAPPMDKLLMPAVGVAFAVMAYYVMKGSEYIQPTETFASYFILFFFFLPALVHAYVVVVVAGWVSVPCVRDQPRGGP